MSGKHRAYCGTARNHPSVRLRQFGRTWERHVPCVAVALAFAAMLYLAVR